MNRDGIEALMDRWLNEPAFRAELRTDPTAAVKASGVSLNEDEIGALQGIDFSLPDDELRARISKAA